MENTLCGDKHAYLIMCHNNLYVLKKLLILIDDFRNDIYIHVDKKWKSFPYNEIKGLIKNSKLFFIKQFNVNWGGYSQINVEIKLLEEATKTNHKYYHLLSGVDLPLRTQDEIHLFFNKNNGKEYIQIDTVIDNNSVMNERVRYYHFLQDKIGRNHGTIVSLYEIIENRLLHYQKLLNIYRTKDVTLFKGPNWFSITHEFACYLLDKRQYIKSNYNYTMCADEIFLQTIAYNSPFKNKIENNCMRHIDWDRGRPYTFKVDDYDELINTKDLFARKFDDKEDKCIIDMIFNHIIYNTKDSANYFY